MLRHSRGVLILLAAMLAAVLGATVTGQSARAAEVPDQRQQAVGTQGPPEDPAEATAERRDALLGPDWARSSDSIVTVRGDQIGLHVLWAAEKEGYAWRTLASLSEPGVETDRWVGNACLTGSGRKAVVTYSPRTFANSPVPAQRGAWTAIVDVATGAVTKLPVRSSTAYFSPGCGVGESAVITQSRGGDGPSGESAETRLITVDTTSAKAAEPITLAGQVTSAVPAATGIVAAAGRRLVSVAGDGGLSTVTATSSVPLKLIAGTAGDVTFMDVVGSRAQVRRVDGTTSARASALLADGPLTGVDLSRGSGGTALVTGSATVRGTLPASVRRLDVARAGAVSSQGHLALLEKRSAVPYASGSTRENPEWTEQLTLPTNEPGTPATIELTGLVLRTKKTLSSRVTGGEAARGDLADGSLASPATVAGSATSGVAAGARRAGSPTDPVDSDATCAVPRNDKSTQVYQPTARQVEWAADQAVTGNLTMSRAANWKNAGMSAAWTPQGLFPPLALTGGGRVPVQVFLGIMSQESNLWQASGVALPGVPANPLIGNFYGRDIYDDNAGNDWDVDFAEADCGYGVTQITDGMRKADTTLSAAQKRGAAVDYATNIAGGLRILQDKWNQTKSAGITHSNGDPKWLENWFFAVWAYNSGLHPQSEAGAHNGAWGLGWLNNPANPNYPANRLPFLTYPADAAHPGDWPYPEKVIGFASYSIATVEGPGFRPAWWVDAQSRDRAKPPVSQFCTSANQCEPGRAYTPNAPDVAGEPAGPCAHKNSAGQYDLECWWHSTSTFNSCSSNYCGNELLRFDSTYPEQPDGTNYPPNCSRTGLPSGAIVVDDVPDTTPAISTSTRGCSTGYKPSAGTFSLNFAADAQGRYPSKVDFHQLGAGFGGHMYFAHTRKNTDLGGTMRVTGKWTFSQSFTQWGRVMVHMPDHGAHTQQAAYVIDPGNGQTKTRYALQRTLKHEWKSLGVVQLAGRPSITLSSETKDGRGEDDIAFDAVAIQPLSAKPTKFVVALGDSYTSGEGASDPAGGPYGSDPDADDYYKESDWGGEYDDDKGRNACHRSPFAWPRKAGLADNTGESLGARNDRWDTSLDFQFHACSGAETENINPQYTSVNGSPMVNGFGQAARGQYGEMSQLDKGYLDANTTLIMMSVGGNDARFSDIIKECIYAAGLYACPDAKLSGETDTLKVSVPRSINGPVKTSIDQTLKEIHRKAPNARIMLMGYPKLLERDGSCIPGMGTAEAPWLNGIAENDMRTMMKGVADNLRNTGVAQAYYSDPIADFTGKAICGNPENIHGIVANTTAGDKPQALGLVPPSSQSFHPKVDGTSLYATAANRTLRTMGQ